MPLNRPSEKSASLLDMFGVAIKAIDSNQRHVGMLYRTETEVRFCHLASHLDLRDEMPKASYCWSEAGLDEFNRKYLAAECARLAGGGEKIPYGLAQQGICFDKTTGRYIPQRAGCGLTCATFISAFLAAFGYPLLQEETWPSRDDDIEWQRLIVKIIRASGASEEHVSAMTNDIGAKRYRPEEVAGAVTCLSYPVSFSEASKMAEEILAMLYEDKLT